VREKERESRREREKKSSPGGKGKHSPARQRPKRERDRERERESKKERKRHIDTWRGKTAQQDGDQRCCLMIISDTSVVTYRGATPVCVGCQNIYCVRRVSEYIQVFSPYDMCILKCPIFTIISETSVVTCCHV